MSNPNRRGPMRRGPMRKVEKAKDFKGTVKELLKSLSSHKISLIIIFVFAIGSTIFSIIGPKILGNATTELYNGIVSKISGQGGIDFSKIASILLFVLGLYILSAVFSYVQGLIMTNVSQKYTYNLRKQVSEKINRLPMSYFDKKTHGEVLSIVTNDIDTLSQSLNQGLTQLITSIVTIVGVLIMMFSINFTMTIVSILILPFTLLVTGKIVGKSQKYFERQQNYLADVNGKVEEMYSGHSVIKAFNAEEKMLNQFEIDNENNSWKYTIIYIL